MSANSDLPAAPPASSAQARAVMQGNRRRDTKPELAVRRRLHALGYRYRVDARPLPELNSRADIVFRSRRIAVFIDGCYWHGCPDHWAEPKSNAAWWTQKIQGNRDRDARTTQALEAAGWTVVREWTHRTPDETVDALVAVLGPAGASGNEKGTSASVRS